MSPLKNPAKVNFLIIKYNSWGWRKIPNFTDWNIEFADSKTLWSRKNSEDLGTLFSYVNHWPQKNIKNRYRCLLSQIKKTKNKTTRPVRVRQPWAYCIKKTSRRSRRPLNPCPTHTQRTVAHERTTTTMVESTYLPTNSARGPFTLSQIKQTKQRITSKNTSKQITANIHETEIQLLV